MNTVEVFAPATIGNIGPGFDVLGLAIEGMGDIVKARNISGNKLIIENILNSDHDISLDPTKNTAGIAAQKALDLLNIKSGVSLEIIKGMPSGSGLGSSAASAVAGANAINCLFGNQLSKEQLLTASMEGEYAVSGGYFADNVAPAIYGGATLTRSLNPLKITALGTINDLIIILVMPKIKILTKESRKIIPKSILLSDCINNMANTASITAAFCKNDYSLIKNNLFDYIIEPKRSLLIKGFPEAKEAALKAGADGMTISGSGPTVFAITNSKNKVELIKSSIISSFNNINIQCKYLISSVSKEGTKQIN